jgi:hypothetical protein
MGEIQSCRSGSGIQCFLYLWIRNPDPRSGSESGSEINIPNHISESLVSTFWVKNTQKLCCGFGFGIRDSVHFLSEIWNGKNRIRDEPKLAKQLRSGSKIHEKTNGFGRPKSSDPGTLQLK